MADPKFFKKTKPFTVQEIADLTSSSIENVKNGDSSALLDDVSALKDAQSNHLSFFDNAKYKDDFKRTKAGACFIAPSMLEFAPENTICLVSASPYKAYAIAAQAYYQDAKPETSIASTAHIASTADIGEGAYIGHNAVIGENVRIGKNAWVEPNATIADNVQIGDDFRIGSNATVSHAIIGSHVRLYPGVRVGQDGFGFAIDPQGHVKVPQLGRVIIEDHVEVGANTTIDRGAGPDTIIGQGTWIDNLVQIGHNVTIGKGCIIVAHVGISGSTQIEDFVAIGGQAGIAGHLKIGMGARIGAQSGVINDLDPGKEYMGSPAVPKTQFFRQVASLNRLIKKKKND